MSIADFYESGEQKQNKAHLENLIAVALVDGKLDTEEKDLLQKFARRMSIDKASFEEMLTGTNDYAMNPPTDKEDRFKRLYNLVKVSLTDDVLDEKEGHLLSRYAVGLGYDVDDSEAIINKTLKLVADNVSFEDALEQI